MGMDFSKARRGSKKTKTKTVIVTTQQRLIILRTWERLCADMAQIGIAVMLRVFELKPSYKASFVFCQKTGNDLIQDKFFRAHAFRFAQHFLEQAANAVVENIDNLDEEVKEFFFSLGRSHVGKPDFRVSYFGIISDAMAYVWEDYLKGRFSAQAEQAWRSVFTFISGTMADGYIQETMDRETAMRSSSLELDPTAPTIRTELPPSMRARLKSTHAKTMSAP
nr:hypothetical protein BaRGS_006918 [Batillaria attramentaria]